MRAALWLFVLIGLLGCTYQPTPADTSLAVQYVTMKVIESNSNPPRAATLLTKLSTLTGFTTKQELLALLAEQPWFAQLDASDKLLLNAVVDRAFTSTTNATLPEQLVLARAYLDEVGRTAALWQSLQPPKG